MTGLPNGAGAAPPLRARPAAPPPHTGSRPPRARFARARRVLPVVATVLLLCVPAGRTDAAADGVRPTAADVASAVLIAVCAVIVLYERRRPLTWPAVAVLGAPAVAFAVATAASRDPAASLSGFLRYAQIFVLVPAATLLMLRSRRDARWVAGALAAVAAVQGAVGVHQYATATGASYAGQDIRAVGTFGPLDVMGMATTVGHGVVLTVALALAPPEGSRRWLRPAALACAAVLLVPLTLSFSRGAWISTTVAVTAVLLLSGLRTALGTLAVAAAALGVLAGVASVGTDPVSERVASITRITHAPDRSVTDRYALWHAAVDIWRDDPVTGVGIKGFPAHRDVHASLGLSSGSDTGGAGLPFQREPLLSPHNMYLLVLSEQGLIGITAVLGSWAALLLLAVRRVRRTRGAGGRPVDCGLAATGLLVMECVGFLYGDIGGPSTLVTALVFGLAAWWAFSPDAVARDRAEPR
jgi:O-antigen ligase